MKKFDTASWKEIAHGDQFEVTSGRVHLRATHEIAVLVEDENGTAIAGTGREVQATFEKPLVVVSIVSDHEDVRVFAYDPQRGAVPKRDVVFTNVERMPMESGNLLEVKKELRAFQLQQRGFMSELRAERAALRKEQAAAAAAKEKPAAEPVETDDEPDAAPAAE